nr:VP2c protein [Blotched snakehead virus]
ASGRPMA